MGFLKIGLLLLLVLRLFQFGQRWRGNAGKIVTVGGDPVRVKIHRGKHKHVQGVRVTLDVSDRFRFMLRPESAFDRFAKRFGIAHEWETGDYEFDEKVFIVSEDPLLLETLSTDREFRELVSTILDFHERGRVECARGKLIFDATLSDVDRDLSNDHLRETYAREIQPPLAKLRERLARISVDGWEGDRDPALRRKGWLIGFSTLFAVAGIVGVIGSMAYEDQQVVFETIPRYGAYVTGGVLAAFLGAAFLWLGRSPHTHAVLLDVLFFALPGAWMASTAGFTWYNEKYDVTAPRQFVAAVASTYTTRHKSSTYHHVVVSSWPDARGERHIQVSEHEYSLAVSGRCIAVSWHAGRLGDGWISDIGVADTNHCGSYSDDLEVE